MKERPILMNGPMVRAILENRKTQTRRPVKPQPYCPRSEISHIGDHWRFEPLYMGHGHDLRICPFGEPGDRLWVRETWKPHCEGPISEEFPLGTCVKYHADGKCVKPETWNVEQGFWCEAHEEDPQWRPSIHMPRWASRITLEVTKVRVERLRDINPKDAVEEGVFEGGVYKEEPPLPYPVATFKWRWDALYAKQGLGWDANPWVWVMEFQKK